MTPNKEVWVTLSLNQSMCSGAICPDWRIWQNQLIKACIYRGNGTCKYVCRCVPLKVQSKIKAEISLSASNKNFVFSVVMFFLVHFSVTVVSFIMHTPER